MDPMPRDRVVAPDEPGGEVGNDPVLIVETDLDREQELPQWWRLIRKTECTSAIQGFGLVLQEPATQR
jgi:hypothetical protein